MKTTISVPEATFQRVNQKAAELGINRSEFYAQAAERYLRELKEEDLTARLDQAILRSGDAARQEALEFARASSANLARLLESDEW